MHLTGLVPAMALAQAPGGDGLRLDATFAQGAVEYLRTRDPGALRSVAASPAAAHLLSHARHFDYDLPKDSAEALVSSLLKPERAKACEQSLEFFNARMVRDRRWTGDALRYLPDDFRFDATLFLQYGYDIGVALGPAASLNCAHRHFEQRPTELIYYAIHELHHVGYMSYQPPPRVRDLKTYADLLRLVRYSTQMEGMAVWAAYKRRADDRALADDADYAALADEPRMRRSEASYFEDLRCLDRRSVEPADDAAWAVVERMSGGERLWYRVGARMAQRIERELGRPTLIALIGKGPDNFLETYLRLR